MKGIALVLLAVLALAQLMVGPSEAAITCTQVNSALSTCVSYLTNGGNPTQQCCAGVKTLSTMTANRPDRVAACNCLKQESAQMPNLKNDAAVSLPQKCKVTINIPISPNTNCNTIP